ANPVDCAAAARRSSMTTTRAADTRWTGRTEANGAMAIILVVDDRPAGRESLVKLLRHSGHRLLEAGDGAEALAIATAERPDLVITDVLMPTMDGYEFVRRLRATPKIAETPVIFFTGHYHEGDALDLARACGVTSVLTKPANPEALLTAVDAALAGAA